MKNPFIPSRSRFCSAAETALLFSVALAGLIAAIIALVNATC
jgi:hypothetical protein